MYQIEAACVTIRDEKTGEEVCLPVTIVVSDVEDETINLNGGDRRMVILVGHVDLPIADEEE